METDADDGNRTRRPIVNAGIGLFPARLREAVGNGSVRALARDTGLSEAVLRTYLRGETYPTLDRLDQIAAAAGKPPGWFIGAGEAAPPSQPVRLDAGSLQAAVETVDTALELAGVAVGAADRAALYVSAYELLQGAQSVPQATAQVLKLIMGGKR